MNVDQHIAQAVALQELAATSGEGTLEWRTCFSTQAIAHAAIASALLARWPGWQYTEKTPGEYDGVDL